MSRTTHSPHHREPLHIVQVLSGGTPGTCGHVRSLAEGLVARGVRVTVCAPAAVAARFDFTAVGAAFVPLPAGGGPEAVAALRAVCVTADVAHAHGLRAGLLGAFALSGRRRRTPLVLTWHHRSHPQGVQAQMNRLLERRAVRAARVVLGVSSDLVDRARRRGARDARLVPVAARPRLPGARATHDQPVCDVAGQDKVRAELGAMGRPLVVTAGRLEAHQGHEVLLTAARAWRHLDPPPLVVIVGEGSQLPALQHRIDVEALPVRLLNGEGESRSGCEVLAVADVAVLPARWAARSPFAQEALHAGVPLVATAVGGVPELVGDAAVLVPYGDADALSAEVGALLADPARRARLAARGRVQTATWPTEDGTVNQVLGLYDELAEAL